jgi:hypothetical protein
MTEDTTTIEVSHEVHRGLDIRKERGESFDDVIRRVFEQTPAPIGSIKPDSGVETTEITELDGPPAGATCSDYDVIAGESCGKPATYLHTVQYEGGDPQELYFCDEHGGR